MNIRNLLLPQSIATPLAALVFALPVNLGAATLISQTDIESYFLSSSNLYALNGNTSYANSGDVSFGITSSGDDLAIGYSSADNYLTISGGTVTDYRGYIGYTGSKGTVTVTGASSRWTNIRDLSVGQSGTGTLTVENGGTVSSINGYVGYSATGSGTATVTGAGSTWTNTGIFTVGRSGTGALTIENGGKVSNANGYIGGQTASDSASDGTVSVNGAGSTWTNSGNLTVGRYGTGTLTIENRGKVSNAIGSVGSQANSNGTVTVKDAGSSWTNDGCDLTIGDYGTGTLIIGSGGNVSNEVGYIGSKLNSNGTVTVKDADSTWINYGNLNVGYEGAGTLTIENGGTVSNNVGSLGIGNGSHGTATVTGAGSTWTNIGDLTVSDYGTGTLTIENGGTVSNANGSIGYNINVKRSGTVTVTGIASSWTNNGDLTVGRSGTGTLTIENGGTVTSVNGYIGHYTGSSGTVTVTGMGSSWTNTGTLSVGNSGTGALTIENGALVTATSVSVGGNGSAIYLNGGTLALASADATTDLATMADLINNEKVYAWDAVTGAYVLVTSWDSENGLVSLTYYEDITTCDALDDYNLTGAYTVLTSVYQSVPEPATYALFGGLGALGLAMYRRRAARKNTTA